MFSVATICTPMALPTSSLLKKTAGIAADAAVVSAAAGTSTVAGARPGNHLRNRTHDPAVGTGTVVRIGAQARHVAGDLMHFLLHPVHDVVHAAGSHAPTAITTTATPMRILVSGLPLPWACGALTVCGGTGGWGGGVDSEKEVPGPAGMAQAADAGVVACRRLAPHLLQNGAPIDGAPHLLQNLAAVTLLGTETAGGGVDAGAAGAASGVSGCGGGLPACRVSYPHFTQKIPLTGAPHLLQKLAMRPPSWTSTFLGKLPGAKRQLPRDLPLRLVFTDCAANVWHFPGAVNETVL